MACGMIHKNISVLFGVEPHPINDLPQVCACGEPLTYVTTVAFINRLPPDRFVLQIPPSEEMPPGNVYVLEEERVAEFVQLPRDHFKIEPKE